MQDGKFLREQMRSFGAATYQRFLVNELIHDWSKIVDASIADKIRPVALEFGVLFVDVQSSAWKDQLKFVAEEIIDAINENFSQEELRVKEIRIAKGFQIVERPPEKIAPPVTVDTPPVTIDAVVLSDEEVATCRARAEKISDERLRETVLRTLLSQARAQKFRALTGWHKCRRCDTLCAPEEIFCEPCKIREREAMVEELYRIFYDTPHLRTEEARRILLERMPHMRAECSPDVVESARTSLIQKVAGNVRFGDEESPDVLKLVMLEKRLPPEQLTPVIIRRTLIDLQFNLSEQPKLQRYLTRIRKHD